MQHPFFLVEQMRAWLQGSPLLQRLEQRLAQVQEVRGTAGGCKQLHTQQRLTCARMCSCGAPAGATTENEARLPMLWMGHTWPCNCATTHSREQTKAAPPAFTLPPLML
jgi:hypothetical protein